MKPTEILIEEHRLIERVLAALEKAASRLNSGESVYLRFFSGTSTLIHGFTDSYHYKKEERVLFPALIANGLPRDSGPVSAMLTEHEDARRMANKLRQVTEKLQCGDVNARNQVVLTALAYVSLVRRHIREEESVLYPLVDQVIPADRMDHILEEFERFEREENGPELHEKYFGMADRLVQECGRSG